MKPIKNLSGHSIDPYLIHGKKSVPLVKTHTTDRMEEGEVFAIETFATTGSGNCFEVDNCSHYARQPFTLSNKIKNEKANKLYEHINKTYGTLPFCRRWLVEEGFAKHKLALGYLVEAELVNDYPPLCDIKGSFTSQFEHTIILKPTGKEVVSRGDDY